MAAVMAGMGRRFASNLLRHLGREVMRILVLGATGYVGSRVVPALLGAGTRGGRRLVVARRTRTGSPGATRSTGRGATSPTQDAVTRCAGDVEAICYLVHSLNSAASRSRTGSAPQIVRDARRRQRRTTDRVPLRSGARRPGRRPLAAHLLAPRGRGGPRAGRRTARCSRCVPGSWSGAGSTSFEVIRQLATLLLVQPVPSWLEQQGPADRRHRRAARHGRGVRASDPRGRPRHRWSRRAALRQAARRVLRAPPACCASASRSCRSLRRWSALGTAALCAAPFWTVTALIESLRHDMVCRPGDDLGPADGGRCWASVRRWTWPSAAAAAPRGPAAQRPRLDPDARAGPRRAARPGHRPGRRQPGAAPCAGVGKCGFTTPGVNPSWCTRNFGSTVPVLG